MRSAHDKIVLNAHKPYSRSSELPFYFFLNIRIVLDVFICIRVLNCAFSVTHQTRRLINEINVKYKCSNLTYFFYLENVQ